MKKIILILTIVLLSVSLTFAITAMFKYKKQIKVLNNRIAELNKTISDDRNPIDIKLSGCTSENFMTNGMNKCTYEAISSWNEEMNKYIAEIRRELPADKVIILNNSQQAWENYYNREKEFLDSTIVLLEGNIHTTIAAGSLYDITKQRALSLKSYYLELKNK